MLLHRLSARVDQLARWFLIGLVGLEATVLSAEVVSRYMMRRSLFWSEELARFLLIWITFIGVSVGFRAAVLTRVDVLDRFLGRFRTPVTVLAHAATATFAASIGWYGVMAVRAPSSWDTTLTTIPIATAYALLAIPIGCGVLLVHVLSAAARLLTEARAGSGPANQAGPDP